jgi:hypothetical protein
MFPNSGSNQILSSTLQIGCHLILCIELNYRFLQPWLTATGRVCVKALTKIFGQKIDRLERHTSDDRHLGNGFGTPNFSASLINFEFLHRLGTKFMFTGDRSLAIRLSIQVCGWTIWIAADISVHSTTNRER